jgi:hypothetical protein
LKGLSEAARSDPAATALLGLALLAADEPDAAEAVLDAGCREFPEDFWLNLYLSQLHRRAGRDVESRQHRRWAEAAHPLRRLGHAPAPPRGPPRHSPRKP